MPIPWLYRIASFYGQVEGEVLRGRRLRRPLNKSFSRLWLELLEVRTLPSTYQWTGGGGNAKQILQIPVP
jgi:hypothetical protein